MKDHNYCSLRFVVPNSLEPKHRYIIPFHINSIASYSHEPFLPFHNIESDNSLSPIIRSFPNTLAGELTIRLPEYTKHQLGQNMLNTWQNKSKQFLHPMSLGLLTLRFA